MKIRDNEEINRRCKMSEAYPLKKKKNNTFVKLLLKVLGQNLRNVLATEFYLLRKLHFSVLNRKRVLSSVPGPMAFRYMCHCFMRTIASPTKAAYD
jgi:hypothetical protein